MDGHIPTRSDIGAAKGEFEIWRNLASRSMRNRRDGRHSTVIGICVARWTWVEIRGTVLLRERRRRGQRIGPQRETRRRDEMCVH